MAWLSREALHRVLQSLVAAELRDGRRVGVRAGTGVEQDAAWQDGLALGEEGTPSLGCDSLELLRIAAAVNEMFCLYDARVEESLLAARTFGEWVGIVDAGWNAAGKRITFTTSGSNGVPKRCTHEIAHLEREIGFLAERFGGVRRVIAVTPSHHIYGFLFTAMLPSRMTVPVVEAGGMAPGVLVRDLREGDLVISFPVRWEFLARSVPRWPAGVQGVTSTAPCPEALKRGLMESGLAGFTEVYGSSETAGVGLRSYPEERYSLMPQWTWADRAEGQAKLADGTGKVFPVQDKLDIAADGSFVVKARVDGAVQVGGVNVFPGRLEEMLRSMPGVADAAVRLSSDIGVGRLKAFVVPDGSVADRELLEALETWTRTMPTPERVLSFTFGSALPRTAMGKMADWDVGLVGRA